ncbi:hypothetical protein DY000_02041053 [Brassica cretica]|uniref:Uncharacterized protein n=1 Tax=Brassica cretica TaxID=69181 RepID=A0ABQ7B6X9_BRACR|nr:hypothetical protein DY000_02041053 [Brassica cretica]
MSLRRSKRGKDNAEAYWDPDDGHKRGEGRGLDVVSLMRLALCVMIFNSWTLFL